MASGRNEELGDLKSASDKNSKGSRSLPQSGSQPLETTSTARGIVCDEILVRLSDTAYNFSDAEARGGKVSHDILQH